MTRSFLKKHAFFFFYNNWNIFKTASVYRKEVQNEGRGGEKIMCEGEKECLNFNITPLFFLLKSLVDF